jgi:hypothetical protein
MHFGITFWSLSVGLVLIINKLDSFSRSILIDNMAQPLEDDTLEKIHSYVKDMDINGTYVDMTEQLLMHRPENPIRFMIDYLSYKHKETVRHCVIELQNIYPLM